MATTLERRTRSVPVFTREQRRAFFDAETRRLLGISGEEFVRRWDRGEYETVADDPSHPEVMRLASLLPFGR